MTNVTPRRPATAGGFGSSERVDAATAGREAVAAALDGRTPTAADLVLIFPSADYDLPALVAAATECAAPAPVVGATGCGAFTDSGLVRRGCVAAFLDGADLDIGVAHIDRDDDDLAGSGRRVAELARERSGDARPHSVLLLLCDGATPDQREVARGTYDVTSSLVPLVGAAAGDDLRWEATWTIGEDRVSDRGLVGVWLNSDRPMGVSHDRSWRPIGRPMLVTRADGGTIFELDGRPALEVYLEESGVAFEPGDLINLAGIARPIGLPNSLGSYDVRQLHVVDDDGTSLIMTTSIPEQTVLQVMATDTPAMLAGAGAAATAAAEMLGRAPSMAIGFSCCTREALMGERVAEEAAVIAGTLGGATVGGFFTCGEFARATGSQGNHNSTIALLVL